jgi:hypothetical protein
MHYTNIPNWLQQQRVWHLHGKLLAERVGG